MRVEAQSFLEDDVVEGKRVRAAQRNKVKLDYGSDSSLSDYEKKNHEDNEDDMFASDDEKHPKKQRGTELLDMNEFERSVEATSGPTNDDDEENSNAEDSDENSQSTSRYYINAEEFQTYGNKREPKIEQFNLREEAEDGAFDKDGNYERNTKSDEDESWMTAKTSERKRAKKAQALREKRESEARRQKSQQFKDIAEALRLIVRLLEPAESPMEALARLAVKNKRKRTVSEEEESRKQAVYSITEACSQLSDQGINEVYDMSREMFLRLYARETGQEMDERGLKRSYDDAGFQEDIHKGEWEFRWKGDETVNGPYSRELMADWKEHHFNGDVVVRRVGDSVFIDIADAKF